MATNLIGKTKTIFDDLARTDTLSQMNPQESVSVGLFKSVLANLNSTLTQYAQDTFNDGLTSEEGVLRIDGSRVGATGQAQDFGATYGIKTDLGTESSSGAGMTFEGVLLKDGNVNLNDGDILDLRDIKPYDDTLNVVFPVSLGGTAYIKGVTDTSISLLLHLNGADAATSTTDSSPTTHTIYFVETAQLDTEYKKFGTASILFDGNSDYLRIDNHISFDFNADYTIDFWVRFNALTDTTFIGNGFNSGWSLRWYDSDNSLRIFHDNNSISKGWSPSTDTWYHVAVVRSGSMVTLYVDGISIGSGTLAAAVASTKDLWIGNGVESTSNHLNGWMDEIRITKGLARWTSNFVVETKEYRTLVPASLDIQDNVYVANTGLRIADTNASHHLKFVPGSDLSADRTLTLTTGDADRVLTFVGDPTLGDWFDQSVKSNAVYKCADPIDLEDVVNLNTLLDHTGIDLNYWLGNTTLDLILTDSEDSITEEIDGEDDELTNIYFQSSVAETPTPFLIKAGTIIGLHWTGEETTPAGRNIGLYFRLGYVDADLAAESFVQIGSDGNTSEAITNVKTLFASHIHVASDTTVPSGKRLWLKVFSVTVSGAGGYPTIKVYYDNSAHHISLEVAGSILGSFVKSDGTTPLTANWDVGDYTITANGFTADGPITTSGSIITTGGDPERTGKFLTGAAGVTVFAYSGGSFDIRAGTGGASEQNVLRVTSAGNFDFYDGNLITTGEMNFRDTDISIGSTLTDGILDISADVAIDMFFDNAGKEDGVDDGQKLNIFRRALQGADDYISLFVDKDRKGLIGFSGDDDLLQLTDGALTVNGTLSCGIATLADRSTLTTDAAPVEDIDIANKKYVDDNSGGSGDVSAAAIIGDHEIVRGDGGAKGVQDTPGVTLSDAGDLAGLVDITIGGTVFSIDTTAPSADVNTLDDYEEGTWTPSITFGGGATGVTYHGTNEGAYTKIGNTVTITGKMRLTSKGSSVGNAIIVGLPYNCKTGIENMAGFSTLILDISFADYPMFFLNPATKDIHCYEITNAGAGTELTNANFADTSQVVFSFSYFTG